MLWRTRTCEFQFPRPALVMGVVNITPDSFSDGGRYLDPDAACEHGQRLVAEGADLLDIGGESTRPGATPVELAEELRRVIPVVERLSRQVAVPISIDTFKPAVAEAALRAGAGIVNDITAGRGDPDMGRVVARHQAGFVAMHMRGTPQTMQLNPTYADVVGEVNAFFGETLELLRAAGVTENQIVLDVGFGFGKTVDHNLELLARLDAFTCWDRPLVVGVSRKSFIARVTGAVATEDRMAGSLACAVWAVGQGARIIRTHDVAPTVRALRMVEALKR